VGPMTVARNGATATLLPDGTVLIAGGVDAAPGTPRQEEIYDPHARSFRATAGMEVQRVGHAAATLQDGRILLVGGFESSTANSEIYDPAAVRFSNMVSISGERYQPSAAALADGRVLVAGGKRSSTRIATAEIFIPTSGGWATTGSMHQARSHFAAVRLNDGKVLVAGGGISLNDTAELFDPATGIFTPLGNISISPQHGVLLPNSKVVLIGVGQILIFDPSTRTFRPSGVQLKTFTGEAVALLQNGSVLIAGGGDISSTSADVLVYSPETDTLNKVGTLSVGRSSATATLLSDGTVLVAGGFSPGPVTSAAADLVDLRPRSRAVHH